MSHAHNKTKRRWLPNLQTVRIVTSEGDRRRVRVCTRLRAAAGSISENQKFAVTFASSFLEIMDLMVVRMGGGDGGGN